MGFRRATDAMTRADPKIAALVRRIEDDLIDGYDAELELVPFCFSFGVIHEGRSALNSIDPGCRSTPMRTWSQFSFERR
jgi:hypothetical protein